MKIVTVGGKAVLMDEQALAMAEVSADITDPVRYATAQALTEAEKSTARNNIGAVGAGSLSLGRESDGLLYILVDGLPVGTGVEVGSASGDVIGFVDSNNVITITGNLPDGSYALRYELEDGTTVDIGNLELDSNVYYSVDNRLTNCASSNAATQAVAGSSYQATISADSGHTLSSVTVTMGGADITSTAVSGGTISINSVTGALVITAVAVADAPVEVINQIPISTDANGNILGIKSGYRLSLSSGNETAASGYSCTGFIPAKTNDVLRIKGIDLANENATNIACYDSGKKPFRGGATAGNYGTSLYHLFVENGTKSEDIYTATLKNTISNGFDTGLAYIRIGSKSITADSVLTVNQEIN